MKTASFDSINFIHFDSLIKKYAEKDEALRGFIADFPSLDAFENAIASKKFSTENRSTLVNVLTEQYSHLVLNDLTQDHISRLQDGNTFTITTGHQLSLFTGPLFFIYKITSTIKLAHQLGERFPDKRFVPVYWMASEDHDFAEISSTFLFGKKIQWETPQAGAVGPMTLEGWEKLVEEFTSILGNTPKSDFIKSLLLEMSHEKNLADATRDLVHQLFGKYGLVIIDGNDHRLKKCFMATMEDELLHESSFPAVTTASDLLVKAGFQTQVNPRSINLFYLSANGRNRIEKKSEDQWVVVDTDIVWSKNELLHELHQTPERFSPNVILRPLYQETILPNLAYIGGPGEIAYWLQLKQMFDVHQTQFPLLILRDSALILTPANVSKMEKLQLSVADLFQDKNILIKRLIQNSETSLEDEKKQLTQLFAAAAEKAKSVDPTLENAAKAELQKGLASLDLLEKKMVKALKSKEEIRLNQLDKLLSEVFPDGSMQERHDNFFQYASTAGFEMIDDLLLNFEPLEYKLTVLYL